MGGLDFDGLFFKTGFAPSSSPDSCLRVLVLGLFRLTGVATVAAALSSLKSSSSSALSLREALRCSRGDALEVLAMGELPCFSSESSGASENKVTRASAVDLRVRRLGMADPVYRTSKLRGDARTDRLS